MRFPVILLSAVLLLPSATRAVTYARVAVADLESGRYDGRAGARHSRVEFIGKVDDAFRDEINHNVVFFVINDGGHVIFAVWNSTMTGRTSPDDRAIAGYVGSTVRVRGSCFRYRQNQRHQAVRQVDLAEMPQILEDAPANPFDVPDAEGLLDTSPDKLPSLGRHRIAGYVSAVWNDDRLLLTTRTGDRCLVQLQQHPAPAYGDFVEVAGIPETDFYRLHLVRAIWRAAEPNGPPPDETPGWSVRSIVTQTGGQTVYTAEMYGSPVRLRGIVRSLPTAENKHTLYIESDGLAVAVDTGAAPAATTLGRGATVEVTGACIFDIDRWSTGSVFPRIQGFRLILRTPADLAVVEGPPWWTPGKFLAVIALMAAGLVLLAVRSAMSRRFAALRLEERTRLAIELHDSVSQNMTSVLMQIDAARQIADTNREKAARRLDIASKTVHSCRDEIRNCIRDLRDNALDLGDMTMAIRKILAPYLADTSLAVRFHVARKCLSDNAAHAVLRIIRELVANAVRHGGASEIRVAGTLEDGKLYFSVKDNGCGFDPETRPGVMEGHFGLVGIAERIRTFDGSLAISSRAGAGTRVAVTLSKLQGDM